MRQPRSITSIKCEARPAWRKFAQARVPVPPALQILGEEFQGLPEPSVGTQTARKPTVVRRTDVAVPSALLGTNSTATHKDRDGRDRQGTTLVVPKELQTTAASAAGVRLHISVVVTQALLPVRFLLRSGSAHRLKPVQPSCTLEQSLLRNIVSHRSAQAAARGIKLKHSIPGSV
jgi:hypothetical protein